MTGLIPSSSCDQASSSSKSDEPVSASRLKMRPQSSSTCLAESPDDGEPSQSERYRLVDLKILSSTLSEAHICDEGKNTLRQSLSQSGAVMFLWHNIYWVFLVLKDSFRVELFCILFISCKHRNAWCLCYYCNLRMKISHSISYILS
jgi:hypothetical protein